MNQAVVFGHEVKLKGVLAYPQEKSKKHSAFLIIGGSGEFDMNGNIKGINMDTYRKLSDFLNENDFITLRYSKRGIAGSEGNYYETGVEELLNDIEVAYTFLSEQEEVDENNIFIIGHSEGAILSTIYSTLNKKLSGMILLSGAGTDLRTAQIRMYEYAQKEIQSLSGLKGTLFRFLSNNKKIVEKRKKFFHSIMNNKRIHSGRKTQIKWYKEHLAFTQEKIKTLLYANDIPILCVFGSKDIQSNIKDLDRKKENISVVEIKGMDHMLYTTKYQPTVVSQKKLFIEEASLPLSQELKQTISNWLCTIKINDPSQLFLHSRKLYQGKS